MTLAYYSKVKKKYTKKHYQTQISRRENLVAVNEDTEIQSHNKLEKLWQQLEQICSSAKIFCNKIQTLVGYNKRVEYIDFGSICLGFYISIQASPQFRTPLNNMV